LVVDIGFAKLSTGSSSTIEHVISSIHS